MVTNENVSTSNKLSTSILSVLTLIATIIALVPAFLSLNDKEAHVYYSYKTSHISIPATIDSNLAINTLEKAGIPGSTVELVIINQGNTGAKNIKFEIIAPNEILAAWTEPSIESAPIWVDLPKLTTHKNKLKVSSEINNLATTRPVDIFIGYKYGKLKEPTVSVFFNGQSANYVQNISDAPEWSKWDVFILPGYIFGAGIILILIWLFINALMNNPKLRSDLIDIFIEVGHVGFAPFAIADLLKAIQQEKPKKDDVNRLE
jgi:hypothetical protein